VGLQVPESVIFKGTLPFNYLPVRISWC
jgi:hypothetical protein